MQKRFIYNFQGDMVVPVNDTIENENVNAIHIIEIANNLVEENKLLKKQIGNLEHTRDFADEVCADCERLENENKQLKSFIRKLQGSDGNIILINGNGYTKSYVERLLK